MKKFQKVRGTRDIYGQDIRKFNKVVKIASSISKIYNFEEIQTPIFEFSEIYERNLGEDSDIVMKEVYKFQDRGGDYLTLRPEFTAGIVRATNENQELIQNLPRKLFSYGPVFRYERPQKGRYRQHHQLNFECFGKKSPLLDVEIISLAQNILKELEIIGEITLEINSLGCEESRKNYERALIKYFNDNKASLSEDSKVRLKINPLRILDSKDLGDKKVVGNAPIISDFYEDSAKKYFEKTLEGLELLNIKYKINPSLVRGLDYYTSTVFEFTTEKLGAQSTVLGGGRYDNLMKQMGSGDVPAVGFASGIERLILMMKEETEDFKLISVVPVSENEEKECFKILAELHASGMRSEMQYNTNIKKRMQRADRINSTFAIIVGEEELKNGTCRIKNLDNGQEFEIKRDNVIKTLKKMILA